MDITGLLNKLKDHGVAVSVDGDYLSLCPGSQVPPDLANEIREHKSEVLAYLRDHGGVQARPIGQAAKDFARWLEWAMSHKDPSEG